MDTRENIMHVAKEMVQSHGYNALSFREIAKAIGVKSASIHYHFPTKGHLGAALAARYTEDAENFLGALQVEPAHLRETVKSYIAAFRAALLNDNRMCLCGIMVAERDDLPDNVRVEVDRFTDVNVKWLEILLRNVHPQMPRKEAASRALAIFSAIEGAQLIARGRGDVKVFDTVVAAYTDAGLLP
ncbi:TetR/AcrR family transcriptional regulator [Rhizobium deserti]|uniref:TetR/AcrR family transcriptional regulator n=2 Tax=Rhizobium deserti TaxID=2547961 RepID=A0A4R5UPR8_9HYPH|nr:TetR/AcrR family transcriptional regulator [Rhizobium deserti]